MYARACIVALAVAGTACGHVRFDEVGDDGGSDSASASYPAVVLADNPGAYYRLGDPQGATLRDATGQSGDATVSISLDGVVAMAMPGALPGDPDTATYFRGSGNTGNGSHGWAQFPDVWSTWAGDFTIEAFVNAVMPAPGGANMALVVCETYQIDGFRTGWNAASQLDMWSTQSGDSSDFHTSRALSTNAYVHVAIVRRGLDAEVYFDGELQAKVAFGYGPPTPGAICGFGAFEGMPSDLLVDELAIYDVALTPAQLAAHLDAAGR